ncbi:MAG: putative lipid II flippase FtsW [Candidatus Blackburnbacteria bacterium]|nr:putative lipid II flippase FtsW [Candidatus Blackburnbacteria bacterium]
MRRRPVPLKFQSSGIDKPLLFAALGLVLFGLVMILNVSVVEAQTAFGDKFFYARRQIIWAIVGILLMFAFSKIPYRLLARFAIPVFILAVLLLIAVLIPGVSNTVLGARRWIEVGPIVIQPSEFAKFATVFYLAHLFSRKRSIFAFLFSVGLVLGLVVLEPDLGTAVVIGGVSLILFFISGANLLYFLAFAALAALAGLALSVTSPYRKARLITFLDPTQDPLGASYHIRQILVALGSGGLFGLGLGQSRQKYLFLPEPTTDSIFAIIGEELGFIGATAILAAFLFVVFRGLSIALKVKDVFGQYLAAGITIWIAVQVFVNLGAMVALIPLTGVPLPFVSYGGSSLVAVLSGVGVLLNISRRREKLK